MKNSVRPLEKIRSSKAISRYLTEYDFLFVFLLSLVFYLVTLAPTVLSGDSAEYAKLVYQFRLFFGRANTHPLHVILGQVFSILPFELAYSLNILSAFFAALTISFLYSIIKKLTGSASGSLLGALTFMVSHTFWFYSVCTEVYSLHLFFITCLLFITITFKNRIGKVFIFLFVFILGLFNHLILILTLPAFIYYFMANLEIKKRKRIWQGLLGLFFILILTFLLFLIFSHTKTIKILKLLLLREPPIFAFLLPPTDLKIFLKEFGFYFLYLFYQFPIWGFFLGFWGIYKFFKQNKKMTLFLLILILCNGLFFIKFTYWQSYGGTKFTFYLPDYLVFTIFIGTGFTDFVQTLAAWSKLKFITARRIRIGSTYLILLIPLFSVFLYALMPHLVSYLHIDLVHARTLPFRDNNRYFLDPNKSGYYGDRKLGEDILSSAADNSIVMADFTIYTTLTYLQLVENMRTDVEVVESADIKITDFVAAVKATNPDRKVYIADNDEESSYYNLDGLGENYVLCRSGNLFEVSKIK